MLKKLVTMSVLAIATLLTVGQLAYGFESEVGFDPIQAQIEPIQELLDVEVEPSPGVAAFLETDERIDWMSLQLLNEMNRARLDAGYGPLAMHLGLTEAATIRAREQSVQMGHARPGTMDVNSTLSVFDEVDFAVNMNHLPTRSYDRVQWTNRPQTAEEIVGAWLDVNRIYTPMMDSAAAYVGIGRYEQIGGNQVYQGGVSYFYQFYLSNPASSVMVFNQQAFTLAIDPQSTGDLIESAGIFLWLNDATGGGRGVIQVLSGMVSDFNPLLEGTQMIHVNYRGQSFPITLNLTFDYDDADFSNVNPNPEMPEMDVSPEGLFLLRLNDVQESMAYTRNLLGALYTYLTTNHRDNPAILLNHEEFYQRFEVLVEAYEEITLDVERATSTFETATPLLVDVIERLVTLRQDIHSFNPNQPESDETFYDVEVEIGMPEVDPIPSPTVTGADPNEPRPTEETTTIPSPIRPVGQSIQPATSDDTMFIIWVGVIGLGCTGLLLINQKKKLTDDKE